MTAVILLGLLVGMQHAIEADHVAAVASLATRSRSVAETARQGIVWGMGHTLTLFLFGGSVLLLDQVIPDRFAQGLELAVGFMLLALGIDVLRRLLRDRIHFHQHRHGQQVHFHAHSHAGQKNHRQDPHLHQHPKGFPLRALFVGMMHGMAGSAALILLALGGVSSTWQGVFYILLFGLGSMIGMGLLAMAIGLPLRYSAQSFTWAHNSLRAVVGMVTLGLGGGLVYQIGIQQGLLMFLAS